MATRQSKKPKPTHGHPQKIRAVLSVAGYGAVSLHVTALTFGMKIISTESSARFAKALYVTAVTNDSFGLRVACLTYAEYVHLSKFIEGYGRLVANPHSTIRPARVQIPSHHFDRTGIPSGASFGDAVETVAYSMNIGFVGARNLVAPTSTDVTQVSNVLGSEMALAIKHDPQVAYFYPSGSQLSGSAYGVDTLYDTTPTNIGTDKATEVGPEFDTLPSGKRVPL
jgi:hypothetical protein